MRLREDEEEEVLYQEAGTSDTEVEEMSDSENFDEELL